MKKTIELTIREYYELRAILKELAVKFEIVIKERLIFLTADATSLLKLGF
jgi:hypothetical protein